MTTAAQYEAMIQERDDWDKLKSLWESIKARDTPGWAEGKAFEYLVPDFPDGTAFFGMRIAPIPWSSGVSGQILPK